MSIVTHEHIFTSGDLSPEDLQVCLALKTGIMFIVVGENHKGFKHWKSNHKVSLVEVKETVDFYLYCMMNFNH